jgi:regulator of nucleoside diphosphate kinase
MIGSEADVLADLALAAAERSPKVSELLLDETSRAKFYTRERIPRDVVVMGATVEFDDANGSTRSVKLVYPNDADISAGRISILTPVGAGLIGLREGQSILWPDREGHERELTIVRVKQEVGAS